jgi:nucleolar GTP-binding protein
MLENEEWRYDKFPEFYNGSNVLDFYDPDITKKLNELEKEEEELLKMEGLQDEVMEDEDESGITMGELRNSLKEVRNKKTLAKMNHKLKLKNKVVQKTVSLTEMEEDLKNKGFEVNTASLRSRSKVRRGIKEIEDARDREARLALEDDSDAGEVIQDDDIAMDEAGRRGRATGKKRLRNELSDDDMEGEVKAAKTGRTLTPAQRHLSA